MSEVTYSHDQLPVDELEHFTGEGIMSISADGINPLTGYNFGYGFVFDHPNGQYIKIDTARRENFLERGSEQQAQDALLDVTHSTRRLSGGSFEIHPFYGAVYGTKLAPVAHDFLTDMREPEGRLTTLLYMTNAGDKFDDRWTREAQEIGTVVMIPGPMAERLHRYMAATPANPNQQNRDQAITNNLGNRWDDEFARVNKTKRFGWGRIPRALELTPGSVSKLLTDLGRQAVLTEVEYVAVHRRIEQATV